MNAYEANLNRWEKSVFEKTEKTEWCIFCFRSGTITRMPDNFKMVGVCRDCNENNIEERIKIFFKKSDSV